MALSQYFINQSIGKIQILHGRFASDLCDMLKRHTGRDVVYDQLVDVNNVVGWIIDILYNYVPYGNTYLNDLYNGLTEEEIQSLINYGYRTLNKYGANIFTPTDSNIYL